MAFDVEAMLAAGYGQRIAGQQAYDLGDIPTPGALYSDVMGQLKGWGNQAQEDLRQNYKNAMGMATQSLASTGMLGTTMAPSMRMGYMKQYSQALNRLNQQLTQTKVGYQTQLGMQGAQMAQRQSEFALNYGLAYGNMARGGGGGGGGGGGRSTAGDDPPLALRSNFGGGGGGVGGGGRSSPYTSGRGRMEYLPEDFFGGGGGDYDYGVGGYVADWGANSFDPVDYNGGFGGGYDFGAASAAAGDYGSPGDWGDGEPSYTMEDVYGYE